MSTTTRPLAAFAAAFALVLTACSSDAPGQTKDEQVESAPAGLETFYEHDITWDPCDDNDDFECGTVEVPMDYENPDD